MYCSVIGLANLQLSQLQAHCANLHRGQAGAIPLANLAIHTGSCCGVYAFYENSGQCLYVGKATSRSFIERIPAHFDCRVAAYMNTFPKKLVEQGIAPDLGAAVEIAMTKELICFVFPDNELARTCAGKLERILQAFLHPVLNTRAALRFAENQTLGFYLPQITGAEEGCL